MVVFRFFMVLAIAVGINFLGNIDFAVSKAMAAEFQSLEKWQAQADKWLAKGRQDKALAVYTEALEQYPANIELLLKRGKLCLNLGRSQEAGHDFQKVLFMDDVNVDAYLGLAIKSGCDGDMKDSFDYFAKAIALDERNAKAYMLRGKFYYEGIGDFEGALADYGRAEELAAPEQMPELLANMMQTGENFSVYYPEGWAETEALANRLLNLPDLPQMYRGRAYFTRMKVHEAMGDYRMALLDTQELMKLYSDNKDNQALILYNQSRFLAKLNMPVEAKKAMLAALQRNPHLDLPRRYEMDPEFAQYGNF